MFAFDVDIVSPDSPLHLGVDIRHIYYLSIEEDVPHNFTSFGRHLDFSARINGKGDHPSAILIPSHHLGAFTPYSCDSTYRE